MKFLWALMPTKVTLLWGSGANNQNDAPVGSDANNKNDAPVDLDATIDWFREEPALRCTSCDTTFLSREDLILHECEKNTQDYTHQCLRCFVRFAAKEHLEMHICPGAGFSIGAAEDPVRIFFLKQNFNSNCESCIVQIKWC